MKKLRIARLLFQPIFLISLALHGIVLMLPAPFDLDKPKPPKKEETVKITKLPATANSSAQISAESSPKPTPESSPKPTPESSPQDPQSDFPQSTEKSDQKSISNSAKKSKPKSHREPSELYIVNSELSESKSSKLSTSKSPVNTDIDDIDRHNNTNTDKNRDTNTNRVRQPDTNPQLDTDKDTNVSTNVKDPLEDFLKNFPFPEGNKPGSLEILSPEADESARHVSQLLDVVIKYYRKSLATKEYALASPSTDDQNFKIYQVVKGNVSQYLHLISKGDNTVIFLSKNQLSRQDLKNLESETAEEREFKDILHQIATKSSSKALTPEIKTKLGDGKYNDFGIFTGNNPPQLGVELTKDLSEKGFDIKQWHNFGKDGLMYSVQKNSFKGFIQLIPTDDTSGTALISLDDFSF